MRRRSTIANFSFFLHTLNVTYNARIICIKKRLSTAQLMCFIYSEITNVFYKINKYKETALKCEVITEEAQCYFLKTFILHVTKPVIFERKTRYILNIPPSFWMNSNYVGFKCILYWAHLFQQISLVSRLYLKCFNGSYFKMFYSFIFLVIYS